MAAIMPAIVVAMVLPNVIAMGAMETAAADLEHYITMAAAPSTCKHHQTRAETTCLTRRASERFKELYFHHRSGHHGPRVPAIRSFGYV
eukprot:6679441-Pyramimonas_sp.AAC.1